MYSTDRESQRDAVNPPRIPWIWSMPRPNEWRTTPQTCDLACSPMMNAQNPQNARVQSSSTSAEAKRGSISAADHSMNTANQKRENPVSIAVAVWRGPNGQLIDNPREESANALGDASLEITQFADPLDRLLGGAWSPTGNFLRRWGWQLPLFPEILPELPPMDDVEVALELDDTLPQCDMPGQLLLDLGLDLLGG